MPYGFVENPRSIGEHIKNRRLEEGIYQRDVAKQIGVTLETINNWEHNRVKNIFPDLYPRIMKFLGYCPVETFTTVGQKIALFRKHCGYNQKEFAQIIGCDPGTLANWENDRRPVMDKFIPAIEEALGTDLMI